jgi:hypothetical protein
MNRSLWLILGGIAGAPSFYITLAVANWLFPVGIYTQQYFAQDFYEVAFLFIPGAIVGGRTAFHFQALDKNNNKKIKDDAFGISFFSAVVLVQVLWEKNWNIIFLLRGIMVLSPLLICGLILLAQHQRFEHN